MNISQIISISIEYGIRVILVVLLFVITKRMANFAKNRVRSYVQTIQDDDVRFALSKIVAATIYFVSGLIMLNILGVDVTLLTAMAGVGGLAITFATKDVASNIVAGIMIFLDKPFSIGDEIEVKGERGVVENITIRATILKNESGNVYIPNTILVTNPVKNYGKYTK